MDTTTAVDMHDDRMGQERFVLALEIVALRGILERLAEDMRALGDHIVAVTDRDNPEELARAGGSLAVLHMLAERLNGYTQNANAVVAEAAYSGQMPS